MKQNGRIVLTFTEEELSNFVVLKILAAWFYLSISTLQNCQLQDEMQIEGIIFPFKLCAHCMDRKECGYKTIFDMKTTVSSSYCRYPNKNGLSQ